MSWPSLGVSSLSAEDVLWSNTLVLREADASWTFPHESSHFFRGEGNWGKAGTGGLSTLTHPPCKEGCDSRTEAPALIPCRAN